MTSSTSTHRLQRLRSIQMSITLNHTSSRRRRPSRGPLPWRYSSPLVQQSQLSLCWSSFEQVISGLRQSSDCVCHVTQQLAVTAIVGRSAALLIRRFNVLNNEQLANAKKTLKNFSCSKVRSMQH